MLLCMRKEDVDRKFGGSAASEPKVGKCSQCSHEVYYDDTSMTLAKITGDGRLVCNVCAYKIEGD